MRSLRTEDPARIGDYAVLGRLGRGAMGTVFLARSPGGRQVAVKVVRPELADDREFRDRFRQEVASMRAVGGFWTAAVVDADPSGPVPWVATEYVPGPTLHDAVAAHGPLPALRGLVAGLAEALRAIHGAGLVHRDLKPANVLLAADGPRVIDFGIAKALESVGLTATGMFVGTPGFLSPEQIEGRDATPASDVFALGAVVVHAATGEGPFGGGDAAALMYRAVHAPPNLDGVPADLRPLVARCLDRRPEARPTPAELLAEVGPPGPGEWLPVRAMVSEETRVNEAAPRPPTMPYTKVGHPLAGPSEARPAGEGRLEAGGAGAGGVGQVAGEDVRPGGRAAGSEARPAGDGGPAAGPEAWAGAAGRPVAGGEAWSGAGGAVGGEVPAAGPEVRSSAGEVRAAGAGRAVFRTSKVSAAVLGAVTTVAAVVCLSISGGAGAKGDEGGALLFFVAFVLFAVPAARLLWILVRHRRWIEVSGEGLTVGRGDQGRPLPWSGLARVRVVEDGRRPWLVVWPREPLAGLGPEYAGGFRAFPVGHEHRKPARQRETRELRAALAWYGRETYDPSP